MRGVGTGGCSATKKGGELWQRKDGGPLPSTSPIPSQEALTHERGGEEADGGGREVGGGREKAGGCGKILHFHCQPNSWPRWLQRPGHLLWVRRKL